MNDQIRRFVFAALSIALAVVAVVTFFSIFAIILGIIVILAIISILTGNKNNIQVKVGRMPGAGSHPEAEIATGCQGQYEEETEKEGLTRVATCLKPVMVCPRCANTGCDRPGCSNQAFADGRCKNCGAPMPMPVPGYVS